LKFVDETRIRVISGNGGNGCLSFRREAFVPKGGPDGGDGGDGGSVIIEADPAMTTLLDCRYRQLYRAQRGVHGKGKDLTGRRGADMVVKVPVGTQIYDSDTGELLVDLDAEGQKMIAAKGGRGGRGNTRFASARNRTPRQSEEGLPGEERLLLLQLKLVADVGLVGMPNSGKSTLISAVSSARPKIADYPFTTKVPALGVVRVGAGTDFVMADIPGLIEGAHRGAGMGDRFLRHIERTKVLIHLIDPSPDIEPGPQERFTLIMRELESFAPDLIKKPMIVAITKMDLPENHDSAMALSLSLEETVGLPVHRISAPAALGVKELIRHAAKLLKRGAPKK
jgi:GTPase